MIINVMIRRLMNSYTFRKKPSCYPHSVFFFSITIGNYVNSTIKDHNSSHELDKMKGKSLLVSTIPEHGRWLLDLGKSHPMTSSKNMGEGTFNDVLCVHSLSSNLLFVYQIAHSGQGKSIEFTLNYVYIMGLETREIVAVGMIDYSSRLYLFSHFTFVDDNVPLISSVLSAYLK